LEILQDFYKKYSVTSPLFEEIKAFQNEEFEYFWNQVELSDEEKDLFPNPVEKSRENTTDEMDLTSRNIFFNLDDLSNPMMTSVALQDVQQTSVNTFDDLNTQNLNLDDTTDLYDINTEIINSDDLQFIVEDSTADNGNPVIDMPVITEENKTVMPCPTQIQAEDIFEIHSYSQQPQQPSTENIVIAAPTKSTSQVYKSKGKVGPPVATAPKVQKKTEVLKRVQSGRITKRQRKPVRHFDESSDDSDYEPEKSSNKKNSVKTTSTSKSVSNNSSNRKVKLYEQSPFSDPDMERCRQNAINAKINRDRKRNEKNSMQKEMTQLKTENQQLRRKNQKYRQRLTSFEARLQVLESLIRSQPRLDEMLKASGNADFVSKGINMSQFDENFSNSSSDEDVLNDQSDVIYYD